MNLYFVKVIGSAFQDYVVLAPDKKAAEKHMIKISGRHVDESKTRLVPNGHFLVGDTFINSEA